MKFITKNKTVAGLFLVMITLFLGCGYEEDLPAVTEFPEITINDFSPKSGKPNELVTITGADFGDYAQAVTVSFGGIAVEVLDSISDETIRVRVPYGVPLGEADLKVKVWTDEKTFDATMFNALEGLVIDSLSPSTGEAGGTMLISGRNFGTSSSDVGVYFSGLEGNVAADIVSVSDTEIEVVIPVGISGPITVDITPESVEGPQFVYPFVGIDEEFKNGDGGWIAQQGGLSSIASDSLLAVEFVGGSQSDLLFDGAVLIEGSSFPFLAVRMTRMGDFDLSIETDHGVFGGAPNSYTGILSGDVFYWDLTSAPFVASDGSETFVSLTDETLMSYFRLNILSRTEETGYEVDFIKSFSTLQEIKDHVDAVTPAGKLFFEFDIATTPSPDWVEADYLNLDLVDHRNTPMWQEDGKFWATHVADRMGLFRVWNSTKLIVTGYPTGVNVVPIDPVVYNPDYPIVAIKGEFWGVTPYATWNNSDANSESFDTNNSDGTYLEGYDDVVYWDGSLTVETIVGYAEIADENGLISFDQWGIQHRSLAGDQIIGTNYSIDWLISFRTMEELNEYAQNH